MNNDLEKIRNNINSIDIDILTLIEKRSMMMKQVLQAKKMQGDGIVKNLFDPKREANIIRTIVNKNKGPLPDSAINNIFESIISSCRNLQLSLEENPLPFNVSIQGIKGSFSEQALLQYCQQKSIKNYKIHYAVNSESVLESINKNKSEYGLVALNNAQGGLVNETIDALTYHRYRIIDSVILLVNHCLITTIDTKKCDIKSIVSHPQALKQCRHYLQKNYPDSDKVEWMDTSLAAADIAAKKLPKGSAAIASASCAKQYHLKILDNNIQDLGSENETLFLLIRGTNL